MTQKVKKDNPLTCSFCGRSESEVQNVFKGPIAQICNECLVAGKLKKQIVESCHSDDSFKFFFHTAKSLLLNWIKLKIQQTKCQHKYGLFNTDYVQCHLCDKIKHDPNLAAEMVAEHWYKNIEESDLDFHTSSFY